MVRLFALSLPLLAACATAPAEGVPIVGEWGGPHVGLSLTPAGGSLDYDCAAGTIEGPLIIRSGGTFVGEGVHTPGWGGPEIAGQVRPSYRIRYSGLVQGSTMTFEGRTENGVRIGPFTLRRGAEPIILRCL